MITINTNCKSNIYSKFISNIKKKFKIENIVSKIIILKDSVSTIFNLDFDIIKNHHTNTSIFLVLDTHNLETKLLNYIKLNYRVNSDLKQDYIYLHLINNLGNKISVFEVEFNKDFINLYSKFDNLTDYTPNLLADIDHTNSDIAKYCNLYSLDFMDVKHQHNLKVFEAKYSKFLQIDNVIDNSINLLECDDILNNIDIEVRENLEVEDIKLNRITALFNKLHSIKI